METRGDENVCAKKQQILRLAETVMAVPAGTFSNTPRFELCGRDRLQIEGRCEIRGCDREMLLLATGAGAVRLCGTDLCVVSFSESGMEITGGMISLEFLE